MAGIFFTSDTHFGDPRILEFSVRPFNGIYEMNRTLIKNWNKAVGPNDIVYHLGDFGDAETIDSLSGIISFLPGNHDTPKDIRRLSKRCQILEPNTVICVKGTRLQLVHEPDEASPSSDFFLFGHIHKLQMVKRNGLNVGVDCHNFTLISLEDALFYREAILKGYYDENVFMQRLGVSTNND